MQRLLHHKISELVVLTDRNSPALAFSSEIVLPLHRLFADHPVKFHILDDPGTLTFLLIPP